MTISASDVIVIPTSHAQRFRRILDQITYVSIRVDAGRILHAGDVHPNID